MFSEKDVRVFLKTCKCFFSFFSMLDYQMFTNPLENKCLFRKKIGEVNEDFEYQRMSK